MLLKSVSISPVLARCFTYFSLGVWTVPGARHYNKDFIDIRYFNTHSNSRKLVILTSKKFRELQKACIGWQVEEPGFKCLFFLIQFLLLMKMKARPSINLAIALAFGLLKRVSSFLRSLSPIKLNPWVMRARGFHWNLDCRKTAWKWVLKCWLIGLKWRVGWKTWIKKPSEWPSLTFVFIQDV